MFHVVKLEQLKDDVLIKHADAASVQDALIRRKNLQFDVHQAKNMRVVPAKIMRALEKECREQIDPLLRQVSSEYAAQLSFDTEFGQALVVLQMVKVI